MIARPTKARAEKVRQNNLTEYINANSSSARVLLATPDTLHFSADIQLSDELYERLGKA
jgi:hypothetical protein